MTVAQVESRELEPAVLEAPSRLQRFAADAAAAHSVALQLAPTPFVPDSYKKDKSGWYDRERIALNVAAGILAGDEVGLSPMQALQSVNIINGTPALAAVAMRALVQSHGHEIWVEESKQDGRTSISATVAGKRKGSEHIERAVYTWDMARQADLTGKTNWQNHPLDMCIARATSRVCRLIGADVLLGLAYSAEELEDGAEAVAQPEEFERVRQPAPAVAGAVAEINKAVSGEPAPAVGPEEQPEQGQPEDQSEPDEEICGQLKPDGSKVCNRPLHHEGRHFYGANAPAQPEPEPIADPETSEPELRPDVAPPEPGSLAYAQQVAEENGDLEDAAEEDGAEESLFPEVSEEEQAAAAEADLAAREEPAQQPASNDDPWADFE